MPAPLVRPARTELLTSNPSSLVVSPADVHRVLRAEYDGRLSRPALAQTAPAGRRDLSALRLSWKDRFDVVGLMVRFDRFTYDRTIEEFFVPEFFDTDFWYAWSAGFAFRPWHDAVEFKRYLWLHIHDLPRVESASAPARSPAAALAAAFIRHLTAHGFRFAPGSRAAHLAPHEQEPILLPTGGLRALCRARDPEIFAGATTPP